MNVAVAALAVIPFLSCKLHSARGNYYSSLWISLLCFNDHRKGEARINIGAVSNDKHPIFRLVSRRTALRP